MNLNLLHRIRAKGVLKGNWAIALLAALIASVPSLLMQIVSTRVFGNWYEKLIRAYYTAGTAFETEAQQLGLQLREAAPLLVGTLLIAIVLTPVLHVGQRHYTLGLLRGEEPDVTAVFRRLPILLKALGQAALILVRCLIWAIPGVALTVGLALIPSIPQALATPLVWLTTLLILVPVLREYLSCAMAPWILADDPAQGVFASVRRSREVMNGKRMQLLSLFLSFYWMLFMLNLALNLFLGALPVVISMTVGMAAELAVNVYMLTAVGSFYETNVLGQTIHVPGMVE